MSAALIAHAVILAGTLVIARCFSALLRNAWDRRAMLVFAAGLYLFSGIGIAVEHEFFGWTYVFSYLMFFSCFCISYVCASQAVQGLSEYSGRLLGQAVKGMESSRFWAAVPPLYVLLHLLPLLYPEFLLLRVFAPPSPEVFSVTRDYHQSEGLVSELVRYAITLSAPLFYLSLFRLRRNVGLLTVFLYLPVYLTYVRYSYVGRKSVLEPLVVMGVALWISAPHWRKRLIAVSAAVAPAFLLFFGAYVQVRMGRDIRDVDLLQEVRTALSTVSLSLGQGPIVMASGARADLMEYLAWIVTLPIPGVFLENVNRAYVNVEISEVVLGMSRVAPKFHGAFAGLFIEAFYLFGVWGFWLHAVFIGCVSACFIGMVKKVPQALFLLAVFLVLMGLSLNRAGMASWLPVMVNSNVLLFVWIVVSRTHRRRIRPRAPFRGHGARMRMYRRMQLDRLS